MVPDVALDSVTATPLGAIRYRNFAIGFRLPPSIARSAEQHERMDHFSFVLPPIRQPPSQCFRCFDSIELFGGKLASPPYTIVVLFVLWISDGFKELHISPNATDIFRWAVAFPFQTDRIPTTLLRFQIPLEEHLVFPAIAKVVLIQESKMLAVLRDDLADLGHGGIDAFEVLESVIQRLRITVAVTVDLELVEM